MDVTLIAISIGNTRTRIAPFRGGELTDSRTVTNDDVAGLDDALRWAGEQLGDAAPDAPVIIASVAPKATETVAARVEAVLSGKPRRVEQDLAIPIGRQLDREALVGEDRLLNAAAAYDTLKQACIIVDAGTAVTVDFVDGAGTFHGGAIAPGAQMMLDSLHNHTAQLPEVKLGKPDETIGHSTAEAMKVAVFYGLQGLVRELVEHYAEVAGAFPTVVATGGDAALLFGEYELVDRVIDDLTVRGIAAAYRSHLEAESEG